MLRGYSDMNKDNLIPVELNSQLKNIDINKLNQMVSSQNFYRPNIQEPVMVKIPPNPAHETNKLLKEQNVQINELQNSLNSIQYENIKLNAQIVTLNKTIDSDTEKLDELKTANTNLKTVNQTLIDNNKHYWRNTFFISLMVGIISFILGMYSNEIKSLLLSLLNILK